MKEKQKLIDLCNTYEDYVLNKYKSLHFFYCKGFADNVIKDCFGELDLKYCGSGACCSTYKDRNFVIKFHTPYLEKITLKCNPTQKIINLCKKYKQPCDETSWYPPQATHFLLYSYVTKLGLSAVQPYAMCDIDSQKKAFSLFQQCDPAVCRQNCRQNMGIYKGRPVIIDWF